MSNMKNKMFNFTVANIDKYAVPPTDGKKMIEYTDTAVSFLKLSVTDAGKKTFYFRRKLKGTFFRKKLGNYPYIKIPQARAEATRLASLNYEQLMEDSKKILIKDLVREYFDKELYPRTRYDKKEEQLLNANISSWYNRDITSITRENVATAHNRLGNQHKYHQANRLLSRISAMFNYAKRMGYLKDNPASYIKKFHEESRSRVMQEDELIRLFKTLQNKSVSEQVRNFILTCIFTGQRVSTIASMKWEDLDLDNNVWIAPAEDMKSKCETRVELVPFIVDILKSIPPDNTGTICDKFVFPSALSKSGHMDVPKKAWKKIKETANLINLRLHDLRRTFGSNQATNGASLLVISKSLGQKSTSATPIYARVANKAVIESVNAVGDLYKELYDQSLQNDPNDENITPEKAEELIE